MVGEPDFRLQAEGMRNSYAVDEGFGAGH